MQSNQMSEYNETETRGRFNGWLDMSVVERPGRYHLKWNMGPRMRHVSWLEVSLVNKKLLCEQTNCLIARCRGHKSLSW
jgi:hypothetical protein